VPSGWRTETIPFPLGFAPSLAHRGAEELRFPPGMFDPSSLQYWSYAFVWRLEDPAKLDAAALGGELTAYYRGLIAAVDRDGKVRDRDRIVANAEATSSSSFRLRAHVFDAFTTGAPIDLVGSATRESCSNGGALWRFALARDPALLSDLEHLVRGATCEQLPAAAPAR
jgi:hypothetical protein